MTKAKTDFDTAGVDLSEKAVLVTGGTGSFGQHFVKMVLAQHRPKRLIVFSRDEAKQHDMAQDFTV